MTHNAPRLAVPTQTAILVAAFDSQLNVSMNAASPGAIGVPLEVDGVELHPDEPPTGLASSGGRTAPDG